MKTTTDAPTLAFCFEEVLRTAADREHRSIANLLILDYCGRKGIASPDQGALFDKSQKPRSGTK